MCSEALMEEYLETGELSAENISDTVAERKLFPCFFGSALKQWGITELLDGLNAYLPQPEYPRTSEPGFIRSAGITQESDCRI